MTTRPRLIRTVRLPEATEARIAASFTAPDAPDSPLTTKEAIALAASFKAEAILITHVTPLRAQDVAELPDCVRLIATVSVGLDHLDVAALAARGIAVSSTPDVLTDCNADLSMLLILAASRRAADYGRLMQHSWGRMLGMDEMLGLRVTGKTLGIIGMGRIGSAVARRARGFDMKVLYNNRRRVAEDRQEGAEFVADLREMLPRCNILSLHLPGGADTESLINEEILSLLPRGAVFVNAARGRLVDEDALIAALQNGQLAAAGLDVCRNEPYPNPRLLALPNLFMTPHIGSATVETRTAMSMLALDNVEALANGRALITPVSVA